MINNVILVTFYGSFIRFYFILSSFKLFFFYFSFIETVKQQSTV